MPVLTDYLSRRAEVLVLVLVIVLSVTLMLLSSTEKDKFARAVNDAVLTPVQASLSGMRVVTGLRAENDSLRASLARQSLALAELAEKGREAERLRELLDFRESTPHEVLAARVIAREAARSGPELKLDKGSRDGVRENLAVVTPQGLVGRVTAVEPRSCFVRPLLARNCRVSARLSRTRTDGILEWRDDLGLHLTFLPYRAEVAVGDRVVSSGLGGVFPRGIAIGRVSKTEFVENEGTLRVLVEPVADFSSLEEVFVVVEARDVPAARDAPEPKPKGDAASAPNPPRVSTAPVESRPG